MSQTNSIQKLVFIYNANLGKRNAIMDTMHKVLSPSTYECNLCDITFGLFSERTDWKKFRSEFPIEMEFLHKDEFEKDYASKFGYSFTYPIVLCVVAGELEVFIDTLELNELQNADQLIRIIEDRTLTT